MTIARPIDSALRDQNLLGAALGDASSWSTWLVALRAAAGLPLNEQQQQTFAMSLVIARRLRIVSGNFGASSAGAAARAGWLRPAPSTLLCCSSISWRRAKPAVYWC